MVARLTVIRHAILNREVLHLAYHARHGEPGERDVEPHGLICLEGVWIMAAYCRTRDGMRNFRIDRIDALAPTGARFTRRRQFTVRYLRPIEPGPDEVRALFGQANARWARESRPMGFVCEEAHPDGVVMVFRPREADSMIPWLLSWGPAVRVLAPATLRARLGALTQEMTALYQQ